LIHRQLTHLAHEVLDALDATTSIAVRPTAPPEAPPASRPGSERRSEIRRVYRRPVPAFRDGEPPVLSLTARDLSSGGIRLEGTGPVRSGERLHLGLEPREDADPLLLWGSVARLSGPGQEPGSIAVVFEPTDDEARRRLLALLEQLPEIPSSGRRASPPTSPR
jgi:hypothetical protein